MFPLAVMDRQVAKRLPKRPFRLSIELTALHRECGSGAKLAVLLPL